MKRDMDLARTLLLRVEKDATFNGNDYYIQHPSELALEKWSDEQVSYHLHLLIEAKLLDGSADLGGGFSILKLTWQGHEFLDTIREPEVWKKTSEGAKKVGGVGMDLLVELAKAYGKQFIKERLGVDLL